MNKETFILEVYVNNVKSGPLYTPAIPRVGEVVEFKDKDYVVGKVKYTTKCYRDNISSFSECRLYLKDIVDEGGKTQCLRG